MRNKIPTYFFSTCTAVAAKAPRKSLPASHSVVSPSSSGSKKKAKGVGGNPLKIWPAPKWQKGLHQFLGVEQPGSGGGACGESSSSSSSTNTSMNEIDMAAEGQMDVGMGSSGCPGSSSTPASGIELLGGEIAQLNSDSEED